MRMASEQWRQTPPDSAPQQPGDGRRAGRMQAARADSSLEKLGSSLRGRSLWDTEGLQDSVDPEKELTKGVRLTMPEKEGQGH